MKQAFKKQFYYGNPEKYRLFLKKHFTQFHPRYYSVTYFREIDTPDGIMYAIKLVIDAIENPTYETIAEVWINNEFVYLWRDHCWTIAVDDKNKLIQSQEMVSLDELTLIPPPCNKTLLIHKIGNLPVE